MRKKGADMSKLTDEQIAFRNDILNKKRRGRRVSKFAQLINEPTGIDKSYFYFDNCVYWITEFRNGRVGIDKAISALRSIRMLSCEIGESLELKWKENNK